MCEEKTKKGGWKAKENETKRIGPVQNSDKIPSGKKTGDSLTLIVASFTERDIAFKYLTATEIENQMEKISQKEKINKRRK